MIKIRIGTFNCENLFRRFKFNNKIANKKLKQYISNGWTLNNTVMDINNSMEKQLTASAILETKADILALQEVENLDALKTFNSGYLSSKYPYKICIDGNDKRMIDVALLSKYPIANMKTHQFIKSSPKKRSYVFSRDCLLVNIDIKGKILPLFINHFKSMIPERKKTMARRELQTRAVVDILKFLYGDDVSKIPFIVLGDFNDYLPSSGLDPLLSQPWLEDIVKRLPEEEQWTHHYSKQNEYKQLDYILLSRPLADSTKGKPVIMRKGLPLRATRYTGPRFNGINKNGSKASDHCPVTIDIIL